MELITLTLDPESMRTRSAMCLHSLLGIDRGLELLERVILHDSESDEFHSGRVITIDFELTDTVYTFQIGIRLPREIAISKLAGFPDASKHLEVERVLELLDDVRDDTRSN